ncbi:MAG: flavodoxin-dependent (E)-4-hydroxy-3-methylbut-2-enyl-diphosphate synthase [Verrucomicrobia bacterium]|nr:flavodoxin-dependent (E)-4-hydroxy-3-methylbut-2-enyl-diphosphate synthase [Verrucomicrobiota bacterium]MCG2680230.1 flavodoxin-dependent (E)-4-hydroxy-3-methylbut-2-enyl-diphosphate synthase [Kiritimatiellia bacterium]MBU4247677.1 flavodoxin-dependent (E)-4-hydroxy-3-methylbut-2-enyl-diphosphate synthase [Verrucomicrobiota bacterium]MBU4289805.1 flavodoxin-dependent (E)-4-hydroxy-3-methylbut-2-enyl-diphosphate synthase [Verrucomicrobiota bacterium]MBU4428052.1 flavodoxin-dependent (E)-4-hyd
MSNGQSQLEFNVFPCVRRLTRQIHVGAVVVGGGAPVSVQTMTKTDTRDIRATVAQIRELETLGCDIIRLAVPDTRAARALKAIRRAIHSPLVADIHFDHRLAILALEAGADGLRINPGNIGSSRKIREIVRAARERRVPIRIGVNAGSLEKDLLAKHGGATAEALVASALRHARLLEDLDYREIKISVKASDVARTVQAYRRLAELTDYPLHLGVTEAGTLLSGTVRSSVALGMLLAEGIGDTLRVSLTDQPSREIWVGLELLRSLGLRPPGPRVISCPTCGRIRLDVITLACRVEDELEKLARELPGAAWPMVAIMGCMVNGPGEAREADIAVAGGDRKAAIYVKGRHVGTVAEKDLLPAVISRVHEFLNQSRNLAAPRRPHR